MLGVGKITIRKYIIFIVIAIVLILIGIYTFVMREEAALEQILIVGTTYDPKTLDPALAYDIASAMVIQNIYD